MVRVKFEYKYDNDCGITIMKTQFNNENCDRFDDRMDTNGKFLLSYRFLNFHGYKLVHKVYIIKEFDKRSLQSIICCDGLGIDGKRIFNKFEDILYMEEPKEQLKKYLIRKHKRVVKQYDLKYIWGHTNY